MFNFESKDRKKILNLKIFEGIRLKKAEFTGKIRFLVLII